MTTPRFADFERILFFTGASVSAESGRSVARRSCSPSAISW
jgi:hypothetical protein